MPDFRPFCVKCSTRMRCKKNEVCLVHKDDCIQSADLYECPHCHAQVLAGYGQPILAIGSDTQYVKRFSQPAEHESVFFEHRHESKKSMITPLSQTVASLQSALSDENTSSPAALALAETAKKAITALIRSLSDDNANIRENTACALGWIGEAVQQIVPALIQTLRDEDEAVCEIAARALSRFGELAIPAILSALRDTDNPVHFYAAFALGDMGEPAVPALRQALSDDDEAVRTIAADALRQIESTQAINAVEKYEPEHL